MLLSVLFSPICLLRPPIHCSSTYLLFTLFSLLFCCFSSLNVFIVSSCSIRYDECCRFYFILSCSSHVLKVCSSSGCCLVSLFIFVKSLICLVYIGWGREWKIFSMINSNFFIDGFNLVKFLNCSCA